MEALPWGRGGKNRAGKTITRILTITATVATTSTTNEVAQCVHADGATEAEGAFLASASGLQVAPPRVGDSSKAGESPQMRKRSSAPMPAQIEAEQPPRRIMSPEEEAAERRRQKRRRKDEIRKSRKRRQHGQQTHLET